MSFDKSVARVIKAEGEQYENVEGDAGGPTKFGITHTDLAKYLGKASASPDEVRAMTKETAIAIYKKFYWQAMELDLLRSEKIQLMLFDQGVNRGVVTAARQFQVVLQGLGGRLGADGRIGVVTAGVANQMDENIVCREYLQAATHSYVDIVKRKPSQIKFLSGWINRLQNLEDVLWTSISVVPPILAPVAKAEVPKEEVSAKGKNPFEVAKGELGQKEIVGSKHNPRIIEYHAATSGKFTTDEIPWCASFVNWVGRQCDLKVTNSALAASFDKYGIASPDGNGEVGDVVTLRHKNGGRHVGILAKKYKKGDETFYLLGGNQSNQVKYSTYGSWEIVAIRKWVDKDGKLAAFYNQKVEGAVGGTGKVDVESTV